MTGIKSKQKAAAGELTYAKKFEIADGKPRPVDYISPVETVRHGKTVYVTAEGKIIVPLPADNPPADSPSRPSMQAGTEAPQLVSEPA